MQCLFQLFFHFYQFITSKTIKGFNYYSISFFFFFFFVVLPNIKLNLFRIGSLIAVLTPLYFLYRCSFDDPGVITDENLEKWNQLYDYDKVIHIPNDCSICKRQR